MSGKKQLSQYDLIRGLQYAGFIFVGAFLFELSTKQEISVDVLLQTLNTTAISWAGIIVNKYFKDYTK